MKEKKVISKKQQKDIRRQGKGRKVGSKVIKRYDEAKTPYQRVLDSAYVPKEDKERLRAEYD